ncbi:gamma carbonic anhydrase family protein [Rhodococcus rhodnii]|uniref:Carbonic anhydrase n=2 Tax=Rhodococcus rhodnii TaxID=38312 RepID=R7WN93_9NOCA|nr:gamma carbonic anhydrase family protein [Rhodococcus rhodnii]EOM76767.1 carbonic anhydrase [Rhodococcus rhodnii LMG 5362]TXG90051.1 gamma carbonic anhydrase family protein [Rhodococcus rhodnii]
MIVKLGDAAPQIAETAWVADNATVVGRVTIAAGVGVYYSAVIRGDMEAIEIGEGTNIQDGAVLHADPGKPLVIGKGISVGHNAILHGCTVEDDVLVGMGATVLNGARIGAGSLIAANALVPENADIPPGSMVAGVPGKVRRELSDAEKQGIVLNAQVYSALTKQHAAHAVVVTDQA